MARTGWLVELEPGPRDAFGVALMGLFKMSGVDVTQPPGRSALMSTDAVSLRETTIAWNEWSAFWERAASEADGARLSTLSATLDRATAYQSTSTMDS